MIKLHDQILCIEITYQSKSSYENPDTYTLIATNTPLWSADNKDHLYSSLSWKLYKSIEVIWYQRWPTFEVCLNNVQFK